MVQSISKSPFSPVQQVMHCPVYRFSVPPETCPAWDATCWEGIRPEGLRFHMGVKPRHFPRTEVKIAYDAATLYLTFQVQDQYIRAVAQEHQDSVFEDSCVEFFFNPGPEWSKGYFNLEMNCGGTMLFHYQLVPRGQKIVIPIQQCREIQTTHSLPKIVNPELTTPLSWTVSYQIPIALLNQYCQVAQPAPQVCWRANFYKCADKTSHPHWLTWAAVDSPQPNFHCPEAFGQLEFQ